MLKKLGFMAALAGLLLVAPSAFAQQIGHDARERGFVGEHRGPVVAERFDRGFAAPRYGVGYGPAYAAPRVGVGVGFYGPARYGAPCRGARVERFGYRRPAGRGYGRAY